jgi:hypothetical protein
MVLSIVFALTGRKLLNLLKFLVCAGAGYYVGSKLILGIPFVGGLLVGLGVDKIDVILGVALAVVFAIVSKFAYAVVFAGIFGFAALIVLPTYVPALANLVYAILAAVAVAVLVLLFRGFVEILATSVLGGAGFATGLYTAIVAVTAVLGLGANGTGIKLSHDLLVVGSLNAEAVVMLALGTLVALIGFVKQTKSRHRF